MKSKPATIDMVQWAATVLAVTGVVLNNSRNRHCFILWCISNLICMTYHYRGKMWGLMWRDVIFTVLSIVGWFQWGG